LSTHALRTSDAPLGQRILRNVDLLVLAIAVPVWIGAQLPALGYAAAAISWVAARQFQAFLEGRAIAKGQRKAMLGARAASLLGRLYLVTIAVFVAGIIDSESGVSGGALAVAVFTSYFVSLFVAAALEDEAR
jgi:hypothetical protein